MRFGVIKVPHYIIIRLLPTAHEGKAACDRTNISANNEYYSIRGDNVFYTNTFIKISTNVNEYPRISRTFKKCNRTNTWRIKIRESRILFDSWRH